MENIATKIMDGFAFINICLFIIIFIPYILRIPNEKQEHMEESINDTYEEIDITNVIATINKMNSTIVKQRNKIIEYEQTIQSLINDKMELQKRVNELDIELENRYIKTDGLSL